MEKQRSLRDKIGMERLIQQDELGTFSPELCPGTLKSSGR
eukprot:CAMPEP_0206405484 /NCGR_PEP_ID=MMETSP0294-20121207/29109_1 /ASSEMBLY_ACC=CAM_ASM_000327 /TAXON_ID=39354 /ORGANISM="Heterosigma akashiwo, Strain CCMP2393" /LENGTH=39 /DNA_ID= /DNA_START= /DNA_END= /DNA_ORIENTATION=